MDVTVEHNGQSAVCQLYVVEKGTTNLFGRSWLKEIKIDWQNIKNIMHVSTVKTDGKMKVQSILRKYSTVFNDGIGKVEGIKATLHMRNDAKPMFCKARPVPYALKPKVEEEIENLENMGILQKVETSEWATPIVAVPKKNGKVRICGDFKVTINPQLNVDQYPLPKIEDIFASLSGGQHFSKIDLRQAFETREFENFTKLNGIKHFRSAPYHPATNGLAERFVQTFKRSMKSMKNEEMSLNKKIANFLLLYRNAPHSITNETPAKLFHGRNLRTCLDLIRPDTRKTVENKIMQSVFEKKGVIREFDKEDHVIVRDYRNHDKWINGQVKSKLGPLTYEVTTESGSVWKRQGLRRTCKMFRFPSNPGLAKKWEKLSRRKDRTLNVQGDRICDCHFKDRKKENGPTIFPWSSEKIFDFTDPCKIRRYGWI
uniref:Uncharacterized protein K02A2.6-like n=1 Tax=Crassostrea virginica TaxID=6565 RepID=A0A8B8D825_CRAVI|nr:uncharacterized protein K02A2.6-like [Crassostrea virginica]